MHHFVIFLAFLFSILGRTKCSTSMEQVKATWSRYTQKSNGESTYYGDYPEGTGACELDPISPVNNQPGWIKVAAGREDYQKSLGCGMCIEVQGNGEPVNAASGGGIGIKGTFKATVVDLCGGCGQGGFDFYLTGYGKWKTSYKAIECAAISGQDGNIIFRFDGSNNWYLKLQVRNSKVVTVGLELLKDNKWICMSRTDNNHFIISGQGELTFPIKLRLTSIFNEQLESTISKLENEVDIPSKIQYKGIVADSKPEDIACYGQGGTTQEAKNPSPITTPAPGSSPFPESIVTTSSTPGQKGTAAKPTARPSPTNKVTTQKQGQTEKKDYCKDQPDGQYPDEDNAYGFIVCSNNIEFKKKCPSGLKYNKDIKVCDWPLNVKSKKTMILSKS